MADRDAKINQILEDKKKPQRTKSREKLTKFLRLSIYNFLDMKDTIKASGLGKSERQAMEESEIAKEGKEIVLRLDNHYRRQCLLHDDRLSKFVKQWEPAIKHSDKILLMVGKICM